MFTRNEAGSTVWMGIAAINGLIAVAAGAFGAHALEGSLEPRSLEVFELSARYQMYHALAMLAAGWLCTTQASRAAAASAALMLAGIILFSGSLYALSLTGSKWLGAVTPFGGTCFLLGWLVMAVAAFRGRHEARAGKEAQ
jgi:uncharacterized membrane protein YgdD (TMEM256/DUF423 family)